MGEIEEIQAWWEMSQAKEMFFYICSLCQRHARNGRTSRTRKFEWTHGRENGGTYFVHVWLG